MSLDRLRTPLSIAFAFVATHNHFVLDRGGKVFKQSAPVIKLPAHATEDDHLVLLGLLNSSTAGFWMNQVFQVKTQTTGMDQERWLLRYEYDGTKLKEFPIPWEEDDTPNPIATKILQLGKILDGLAVRLHKLSPDTLCAKGVAVSLDTLQMAHQQSETLFQQMAYWQEELDWASYVAYGLLAGEDLASGGTSPSKPEAIPIDLGQRAFEIALARKVAAGAEETQWFARHSSKPITEIPKEWPDAYQNIVQRRLDLIESHPDLVLIEKPEFKRRWNREPFAEQEKQALKDWLLLRLERTFDLDGRMAPSSDLPNLLHFSDPELVSLARLAQVAGQDPEFLQMGALYRSDQAFDVFALVGELVESETVPLLPACRYKPEGLIKRTVWERTWDLQRAEDRGEPVGTIPVPPKYASSDFQKADFWRLRGKLDVPKERWVGFPQIQASDGSPILAWAGYDHLQLAQAISSYFVQVQEREGGSEDSRLKPLLASLVELLPWLKQWHNEIHPEFGQGMGDYFAGFAQEEARRLGLTLEEARAWQPEARSTPQRQPAKPKTIRAPKDLFGNDIGGAAIAPPVQARGRKPKADPAERETQKNKIIELARASHPLSNRTCLEGLGLEATPGNTTLVSSMLKELSGEAGPLTRVGTKGPGVYYTLKG